MASTAISLEDASTAEMARELYPAVIAAVSDLGGKAYSHEITVYLRDTLGHKLCHRDNRDLQSIVQIALCKAVGLKELVYNGHYEVIGYDDPKKNAPSSKCIVNQNVKNFPRKRKGAVRLNKE